MTTLATRLAQLSGLPLGTATMAEHLRAIVTRFNLAVPAQATVAAILIAYSGLPAGQHTVAEHLAVNRAVATTVLGGGDDLLDAYTALATAERERIQRQNDLIIMTVIAAVTGGMLT